MNTFLRIALPVAAVTATTVGLGAVAAPRVASAARQYFSTTKAVSGYGSATCPYGWKLSGGGVRPLPNDYFGPTSSKEYQLRGSYPDGNTWRATATLTTGSYSSSTGWRYRTSPHTPNVWAICLR